ncbi:MAG: CHRD domain-containing protein [Lacibacter sp.]
MRRVFQFALAVAALFTISSCSKQDAVIVQDQYQAVLLPSNEVPARVSDGRGFAIGYLNPQTKVLTLRITYGNLRAPLTAWHIHKAPAGVNGPVIHNFGAPAPSEFYYISAPLTADQENDLITANYYVNLHSTLYPGGEIRGQLLKR